MHSMQMLILIFYISENIFTTSLAALTHQSASTCTIPCKPLLLHCALSGIEIEWLSPKNIVINSSTDTRIVQSKKIFLQ